MLIFENGLSMHEQMILEEILVEIGRTNALQDFPSKLTFSEANVRLVQYNKAAKEKEKVKVQHSWKQNSCAYRTSYFTRNLDDLAMDTSQHMNTCYVHSVVSCYGWIKLIIKTSVYTVSKNKCLF